MGLSGGPPTGDPTVDARFKHFESELGPQFDPELHAAIAEPGDWDFGGGKNPRYDLTKRAIRARVGELLYKYDTQDAVTPEEKAEYAYLQQMMAWSTTKAGWDRLLEIGAITFRDYQTEVQLPRGPSGAMEAVPVMGKLYVPAVGARRDQLADDRLRVRLDNARADFGYARSTEMEPTVSERDWRVTSMHHSEPWWLEEPGNPNRPDEATATGDFGTGVLPAYKMASYANAERSGSDLDALKLRFTIDPTRRDDRDATRNGPNPGVYMPSGPNPVTYPEGLLLYGSGNYRFEDLDGWTAPPWSTKEATGDTDKAPAWDVPADILEFLDGIDNSPKDERLFPMAMGFVKDVPKAEGWGDNVFGLGASARALDAPRAGCPASAPLRVGCSPLWWMFAS